MSLNIKFMNRKINGHLSYFCLLAITVFSFQKWEGNNIYSFSSDVHMCLIVLITQINIIYGGKFIHKNLSKS